MVNLNHEGLLGAAAMNSIGYSLSEDGERCVVTESWMADVGITLHSKIKLMLKDMKPATSTRAIQKFLEDLRKARDSVTGSELKVELDNLRYRFDTDPTLLSTETAFNLTLSFR